MVKKRTAGKGTFALLALAGGLMTGLALPNLDILSQNFSNKGSLLYVSANALQDRDGNVNIQNRNDFVTEGKGSYPIRIQSKIISPFRNEVMIDEERTISIRIYRNDQLYKSKELRTRKEEIIYSLDTSSLKKNDKIQIFVTLYSSKGKKLNTDIHKFTIHSREDLNSIKIRTNEKISWNQFKDEKITIPVKISFANKNGKEKPADLMQNIKISASDGKTYVLQRYKNSSNYYVELYKNNVQEKNLSLSYDIINTNVPYDRVKNEIEIRSEDTLETIAFPENEVSIDIGETYKVPLKLVPFTSSEKNRLKWESADPNIAKVDDSGKIQGIKKGTTSIRVTGKYASASMKLTVKSYLKDIVTENDVFLEEGVSQKLNYRLEPASADAELSFRASDLSIIDIDKNGLIQAKKAGKCNVLVSYQDIEKKVPVTVMPRLEKIVPKRTQLNMAPEDTYEIEFTTMPDKYPKPLTFSYKSMDNKIAKVSESGKITAVGEGDTQIIISHNDIEAAINIRVNEQKKAIELKQKEISINDTFDISELLPDSINRDRVRLEVPKDATLTADGLTISPVNEGSTVLTILVDNVPVFLTVHTSLLTESPVSIQQPITTASSLYCLKDKRVSYDFLGLQWNAFIREK